MSINVPERDGRTLEELGKPGHFTVPECRVAGSSGGAGRRARARGARCPAGESRGCAVARIASATGTDVDHLRHAVHAHDVSAGQDRGRDGGGGRPVTFGGRTSTGGDVRKDLRDGPTEAAGREPQSVSCRRAPRGCVWRAWQSRAGIDDQAIQGMPQPTARSTLRCNSRVMSVVTSP